MNKKCLNGLMPLFAIVFCVIGLCIVNHVDAADIRQRKYGQHTTIDFELYEVDGIDFRIDAADAGTDCSIRKDGGASATCTNDFVDEGDTYSLHLTSAEMTAERIILKIVDTAAKVWLDRCIIIETYDHASAEHDPNTVASRFTDPITNADIEAECYDALELALLDKWMKVATGIAADEDLESVITAGSVLAHVLSKTADATAFKATTDSLQGLRDTLPAANATSVWATAMSDLAAGAPSATASVLTAINWIYEAWRNKTITTGAGEVQLYKDDASTILAETDVSDDGTDFTKGEYGAED